MLAVCALIVLFIGVPSIKQWIPQDGGNSVQALLRKKEAADQKSVRLNAENAQLAQEIHTQTWAQAPDQLPPVLLKALNATAVQAGVRLAGFRPGRVTSLSSGSKLPITVQITAPYPQAMAFLDRLRATQKRVALERMQIASMDADSDRVNMELRLATYSMVKVVDKDESGSTQGSKTRTSGSSESRRTGE